MELPVVQLPSTAGARIAITAKTFAQIARTAEDMAYQLRSEAQTGTQHPRTILEAYTRSLADLEAIRAATEAEIAAADEALKALEGRPTPSSPHPLIHTTREMSFTAAAFSRAGSSLARDKAETLLEDTKLQVRAMRDYAARSLGEHEHRLDAMRSKLAAAFRAAISTYSGDYGFALKDAAALLKIPGIPADDETVLPAPDFNDRLPHDDPARKAATLQTVCSSREATEELIAQHGDVQLRKAERRKTRAERAIDQLKQLEDR